MIQALLMGAGLGMQAYSAFKGSSNAKQQAAVNAQIAAQEQAAEEQRHKQMLLNSRRQQLEAIRNGQLARSMALNSATATGAQMGSGLSGGIAQAAAMTNYNLLGISQNTEIGESLFSINSKISGYKRQLASLGGEQATTQAISGFGGNLLSVGMKTGGNMFMGGSDSSYQSNPWMQGSSNQIKIAGTDF